MTLDRRYRDRGGLAVGVPVVPLVLHVPCEAHDAAVGEPCWQLAGTASGVCGSRISAGLGGQKQ